MLDPDLLRAFVAVADHGSFTRGAAALNRTQSAVSMQIQRLEGAVGAAVLDRSRRGLRLTPAGEVLLGYARRILSVSAEAIGRLRDLQVEGTVRLGVMEDYGTRLVPPLLAGFAAAHPRIQVEMVTGLTTPMLPQLGERFDLVLAMHAAGDGGGTFLRRERAVWAAGRDVAAETRSPLPLALYPQGCLFRAWAMASLDAAGLPWRLAFVSHSLAAVTAIAAQGLAVTVVKAGLLPPELRPLGERDGLPPLPEADIRLHRAPGLAPAGELLAGHLAAGLALPDRVASV
ncbi:LysR family transcriptional regulator [Inquilinus sp. Marseille-Q2685]|uniref:LysR family transcriptional regulator n=1 Tax=Inquilinus sp. Marseille-Q2685 TaxID=2866581 RepID=UPI001CE3E7A7|nr:LysR family transcriptional regulator [Inquilinus sp. Marseille-Q2685]